LLNFGYIDVIHSLNKSRILKFENFSDLAWKTWEPMRDRCLKMWLQPPLPSRRVPNLK